MAKYRVGTRASKLALTQTQQAVAKLREANPDCEFEIVPMTTGGDQNQKDSLHSFGGVGVFVKELEHALLKGEVDVAVHSLKDVPNDVPPELELACFPERESASDVLLYADSNTELFNFDSDIISENKLAIGTGSPRRIVQLQRHFPNAEFKAIRGNIDTRQKKLQDGEYDAIVLAEAGMNRLGLSHKNKTPLPHNVCLPAVGQGCLVFEIRKEDSDLKATLRKINDEHAELSVLAERKFMAVMEGSCQLPLGAIGSVVGEQFTLQVVCGNVEQQKLVTMARSTQLKEDALTDALALAEELAGATKELMSARGILIQA